MGKPTHAGEVSPILRNFWTARPLLVAYAVVTAATLGLLVNRQPSGAGTIPAMTDSAAAVARTEPDRQGPPLWLQLFRPGLPTARRVLHTALPALAPATGAAEGAARDLRFWWTGPGQPQPQTLFQAALPFLRPPAEPAETPEPPTAGPEAEPAVPTGESPGPEVQPAQEPPPAPATEQRTMEVVNGGLPLVGIYHTHDYESYISEFPDLAVSTDQDLMLVASFDHSKRTIVDVGEILARRLRDLGVTTVHAPFRHQELGYDYAYQASRVTAQRILREAPTVKVLLDLHRDGNMNLDSTTYIDGLPVARVRCVIGAREDLVHWQENLAFCNALMAKMEEAHPGITLPTLTPQARYNQDLLPGAILLEIGNALNTFEEAERAIHYLAEALAELLRSGEYPGAP